MSLFERAKCALERLAGIKGEPPDAAALKLAQERLKAASASLEKEIDDVFGELVKGMGGKKKCRAKKRGTSKDAAPS